jgi:hypothetical protein
MTKSSASELLIMTCEDVLITHDRISPYCPKALYQDHGADLCGTAGNSPEKSISFRR